MSGRVLSEGVNEGEQVCSSGLIAANWPRHYWEDNAQNDPAKRAALCSLAERLPSFVFGRPGEPGALFTAFAQTADAKTDFVQRPFNLPDHEGEGE